MLVELVVPFLLAAAGDVDATRRLLRCMENQDWRCLASELKTSAGTQKSAEYLAAAAEAYLLLDRKPEAIAAIDTALAKKPGDYDLLMQQGRTYQRCGQQVPAIQSFLLAAKAKPPSSEVFYSLGMSFFLLREYERASKHFKHAVDLNANDDKAEFMLAALSVLQKDDEASAMTHMKRALALKPDNPHYLVHYGVLLLRENQFDQALTALDKAVQLDPSNPLAHFNLGRLLRQMDQLERARTELEAAVRLRPDLARAYYQLGGVYRSLGETAKMNDALQKFEKLKDQDKDEELIDGPPSYSFPASRPK